MTAWLRPCWTRTGPTTLTLTPGWPPSRSSGSAGTVAQLAPLFAGRYAAMLGTESGLDQWRSTFSLPVLVTVARIVAWARQDGQLRYRSVP
jgi:hypothetical protein